MSDELPLIVSDGRWGCGGMLAGCMWSDTFASERIEIDQELAARIRDKLKSMDDEGTTFEGWDNPTPYPLAAREELLKAVVASPSPATVRHEMRTYISMAPEFNHVSPDVPIPTPMEQVCPTVQQRDTQHQGATGTSNGNEKAIFLFIMFMLVLLTEGGRTAIF